MFKINGLTVITFQKLSNFLNTFATPGTAHFLPIFPKIYVTCESGTCAREGVRPVIGYIQGPPKSVVLCLISLIV